MLYSVNQLFNEKIHSVWQRTWEKIYYEHVNKIYIGNLHGHLSSYIVDYFIDTDNIDYYDILYSHTMISICKWEEYSVMTVMKH